MPNSRMSTSGLQPFVKLCVTRHTFARLLVSLFLADMTMLIACVEVSKEDKDAYCEDIIELLELQDLADGMIGFPGYGKHNHFHIILDGLTWQGLSVEARKRVTIGVELAAKPDLLLFLDEPTS
jgi:ABC-type glutathione transport system ATPase component